MIAICIIITWLYYHVFFSSVIYLHGLFFTPGCIVLACRPWSVVYYQLELSETPMMILAS